MEISLCHTRQDTGLPEWALGSSLLLSCEMLVLELAGARTKQNSHPASCLVWVGALRHLRGTRSKLDGDIRPPRNSGASLAQSQRVGLTARLCWELSVEPRQVPRPLWGLDFGICRVNKLDQVLSSCDDRGGSFSGAGRGA